MESSQPPPKSAALWLSDAAATISEGERLATALMPGDIIALTGGLGAGKTHFTQGICSGLGSTDAITSPTFSLVHEYRSTTPPVFHFDFYRMRTSAEIIAMGWDDYLDQRGIYIIEWADLFPELFGPAAQWLRLSVHGTGRRLERITAPTAEN